MNTYSYVATMWEGLKEMPGQKLFTGNKDPGFHNNKYDMWIRI